MLLSFVIPCYNSSRTILLVLDELRNVMKQIDDYDYEIIMVNDGSSDNVDSIIKKAIKENNEKIKYINLARNFGQASAKMAAYKFVEGDIIIGVDDDGQTPIDELHKLIEKINEGYDVVYGSYADKKHSKFRNIGSKINDLMARTLIKKPKDLKATSFYAMRRFIIDEILNYKNPYPYPLGISICSTSKITNVEVKHRERLIGKSNYTFKKLVSLWFNGALNFSVIPLRISLFTGIAMIFIGLLVLLIGSVMILTKNALLNSNFLIGLLILFMGGINLAMIGIVGEYVGRIFLSINNIPQYVIREIIEIQGKEKNDSCDYRVQSLEEKINIIEGN